MRVRYIYSACVSITNQDVSVLCDPWFTQGAYEGSWYHYPLLQGDPVEICGPHDFVYVSHIHPDHYDPEFLLRYLAKYPDAQVIVADFRFNYLSSAMRAHGIPHVVASHLTKGDTELYLRPFQYPQEGPHDIDSILTVRDGRECVVNWNDCGIARDFHGDVRELARDRHLLALLPAAGASGFPHMHMPVSNTLIDICNKRRHEFINIYAHLVNFLQPVFSMPFAGKYLLGGKNHSLNPYRGWVDVPEYIPMLPNIVSPADGGASVFDLTAGKLNLARDRPYSREDLETAARALAEKKFSFETEDESQIIGDTDWESLARLCYTKSVLKSKYPTDYYISVQTPAGWVNMNINRKKPLFTMADPADLFPRSEIQADHRYLHGAMTRKYNWNNGIVGSLFSVTNYPGKQAPFKELGFLHDFHVGKKPGPAKAA